MRFTQRATPGEPILRAATAIAQRVYVIVMEEAAEAVEGPVRRALAALDMPASVLGSWGSELSLGGFWAVTAGPKQSAAP